ncbi:MAG: hypothetical protein QOC94_2774 [Actinoplanes sp.]|jgi:hypothetical protein|nr:hypothetical protein [Actinoplanes sp.]
MAGLVKRVRNARRQSRGRAPLSVGCAALGFGLGELP